MSLENIQSDIEELDAVELATVETERNKKGVVLHITLSESYEGEGDSILNAVLDKIPREVLPTDFESDSHVSIYYDAINIEI